MGENNTWISEFHNSSILSHSSNDHLILLAQVWVGTVPWYIQCPRFILIYVKDQGGKSGGTDCGYMWLAHEILQHIALYGGHLGLTKCTHRKKKSALNVKVLRHKQSFTKGNKNQTQDPKLRT